MEIFENMGQIRGVWRINGLRGFFRANYPIKWCAVHTLHVIQHALHFNAGAKRSSAEFPGDLGYVLALEAGDGKLIFCRLPRTVAAGKSRSTVR